MKTIIERSGCTAGSFTIDGVEETDLTQEQRGELIDYLVGKLKEKVSSGHIRIDDLVRMFQYEDCESGPRCETCFDSVCTTTWKI